MGGVITLVWPIVDVQVSFLGPWVIFNPMKPRCHNDLLTSGNHVCEYQLSITADIDSADVNIGFLSPMISPTPHPVNEEIQKHDNTCDIKRIIVKPWHTRQTQINSILQTIERRPNKVNSSTTWARNSAHKKNIWLPWKPILAVTMVVLTS